MHARSPVLAAILAAVACGATQRASERRDRETEVVDRALASSAPVRLEDAGSDPPLPSLRLVATSRNGRIRLHPLDGALAVQAGARFALAAGGALGKLESLGARGDKVDGIFGRFPDDLFTTSDDEGVQSTQRWSRGARTRIASAPRYLDVTSWSSGRLLALVAASPAARFEVLGKKPDARLEIDAAHCWEHAAALPTGEVFALGKKCGQRTPIFGRWVPGETKASVDVLPGVDWQDVADLATAQVRPLSRSDVAVSLTYKPKDKPEKPYVARYDGEKWLVIPVPERYSTMSALARGADGSIWAALTERGSLSGDLHGELWRRAPSGSWQMVALPEGEAMTGRFVYSKAEGRYVAVPGSRIWAPADAWVSPGGELWVVGVLHDGGDETWGLFHDGPRARARDGGIEDPLELPETPVPPPALATTSCQGTFFVALGVLGGGPSEGSTFPQVREALAARTDVGGVVILETFTRGKRRVGLFTTSHGVAEKLVTVPAVARGRKLVTTCEAPVAIRVVRFDATGRVIEEPGSGPDSR